LRTASGNRGRRILRHEDRIRAVKFENGVDILIREQSLISIQEFLELLPGASGFFRARGRLAVVAKRRWCRPAKVVKEKINADNWQEAVEF